MPTCPGCGSSYQGTPQFCPSCGKPLQYSTQPYPAAGYPPPGYMPTGRIEKPAGVIVIGILQILGSIVVLLIGLGLAASLGPLGLVILPFAVLPLIFAISLFTGHNWARILMLIGGVFDILSIIGIIWGIIVLWYFTRPHVVAYFKQPK